MATLGELLTDQEITHLEDLVNRKKITTDWIQDVFIPRLADELDHIDWVESGWRDIDLDAPKYAKRRDAYAREQATVLQRMQERRATAFQRLLDPNIFQRGERELNVAHRALRTGEAKERLAEYLTEQGPIGVAKDVGKSLVESIPRGVAATGKTFQEGLGETPIQRIGEMTGAIPIVGGTAGLAARLVGRSALKAAGRSVLRETGEAALRKVPGEAVQEALDAGVGSGRAGLAKALSGVAEATRIPGYIGETADIAGAQEDILVEGLLEILGEGAVEAGRFAGRRAVDQLGGETQTPDAEPETDVDPIAAKQQQRADENDAAAAAQLAKQNAAKIQAALDVEAAGLTQLAQQLVAGKAELTPEDVAGIEDTALVDMLENQIATTPEFQAILENLETLGLQNAADVMKARILELHQHARTAAAPPPETPEQAAAADLAGQPTAEIPPELQPQPPQEAQPDEVQPDTEPTSPDGTDTQTTLPAGGTQTETAEQVPTDETPTPTADQDWAGLDAEIGSTVLETLKQDPDANEHTVIDNILSQMIDDRTLSAADAYKLRQDIMSQIAPAVEEINQHREAEREFESVPETRVGTETVGYQSDGVTEHRVRPVLRELDEVVPSHQLDGEAREDYPEDLQPREGRGGAVSMEQVRKTANQPNYAWLLEFPKQFRDGPPLTSRQHPRRVVSGNGRTLALRLMQQNHPENWQGYQDALRAELEKVGIDPAEADAMENPVLTYELVDPTTDEVAVARDANVQATLDNTAAEQATHDTSYFDDDLMALWQPGEGSFADTLKSEENQQFRTALFNRIPTQLVSGFMTGDNRNFSDDGIKRIQNAMIRYVFGGEIGGRLSQLFIESGIEDIKSIETMLRNAIASLAYAKANGQDIGTPLASAIFRFLEFNERANRDTRQVGKNVLLYAEIDALYNTPALIDAPSLLEKQLLYLIYAKRTAPRQLADDFQTWARTVVSLSESTTENLFDVKTSEAIFAGMIRDHIRETIFETRQTQDGQTVLLPPDSMPPELVNLREDMDKIPFTDGKQRFANDWIDAFLRLMNEGQQQQEVDPDATQTTDTEEIRTDHRAEPQGAGEQETQTTDGGVEPRGGETPRRTEREVPEGTPDRDDTRTGEGPGSEGSGVAPTQPGGTDRDADGQTQGAADDLPTADSGRDLSVEEAINIASVGTVSLDEWNTSPDDGKRSFLRKQEQAIPVHLQTGAITAEEAEQKREAIALLRSEIDGTPQTADTETPIDTNQVVGVSRRIEPQAETTVSPLVQRDLEILGLSVEQWEEMKADGSATDFINSLSPEQQEEVEYGINLVDDLNSDADAQAEADFYDDEDFDFDDDDDIFNDVSTGILRDITDQQRSDFESIRRKLFLARTIARLAAKENRTPIETAQLRALQAPQRTDAQQKLYERMLNAFVDGQVKRLQAKPKRSANENRILDTLSAVQAEGLPEEAAELSLYADLETPDQEHSRPLAETKTLAGVQTPDTAETDVNLPEDVTGDTTKLSPAQLTSVKSIIAAFKRKIHTTTDTTVQGGFLLGDKPGVGKTRQALAVIWHYMRQGIQNHFVLAPNQQILNNFSTDMQAMGGSATDISHYNANNQKLETPIGTTTYNMLTRKPDLAKFATTAGNQNAIADIVEHLTGVRPTLQQTHPAAYQDQLEAYRRMLGNVQTPTLENVVAELRRQAATVNLDNPAHLENFRRRLTPTLADLLIAERTQEGQQEIFEGSELEARVNQLLAFGENILATQPDPDFAAKTAAFQGVIVLDEMHKVAGTASEIGQTIATLDTLLPNAKFLYMSATPFKEVDNLWFTDRLGLWGANQPFPSFDRFRRTFKNAARAVKEVIPLHLKQIGRYISRSLSSKETRYAPIEVPLTDTEKRQYDTAVRLVQGIRQRFEGAIDAAERTAWGSILESEGEFHQYRAKYMRMFYGSMQPFFLAVLDAMKAQGLESDIKAKLEAGDKLIVQLENTWDATEKRALARGQDAAGPFDLLIDFIENENTFPTHQHITEVRTKSDGSNYTVVVPRMEYNENGERVRAVDPSLKRLQLQLLNQLRAEKARAGDLSFAADIIHQIAADAGLSSGEISGRRNTDREALATAFSETTDLNLIVLGPAGLTGINLPVRDVIKDAVGGLHHYLLQSSWNVNTFEQGLGRGKRSDSAMDPQYQIVYQDVPGADRVLGATLAKFAEMGALAGQADNPLMQNIDKIEGETSLDDDPEADVFEEDPQGERSHVFGLHGKEALEQLWMEMLESGDVSLADALGLAHPEYAGGTGFIDPDTVPSVQQFFQRLLHQSTTIQPEIYAQFESRLKRIVAYRRELGELDVGANDLNSKDGRIVDKLTIFTDPDTGQTADMVRLSVKRKLPRRSWDFAQKVINGQEGYEQHGRNFSGIYTDADGHIWAVFEAPHTRGQETEFIRWGPRGTPVQGIHAGENRITETQLAYDLTHIADMAEAQRLWEAEDQAADTTVDSQLFMATGLILPKWQNLSTRNTQHALMGVIPMLDGSQLHGRVIPSGVVSEVLTQIGGVDPDYFSESPTADSQPPTDLSPNGEEATSPNGEVDIPAIVRDIIGEETDPQVAARLEGIVAHIHKKLPLRLRGHLVRSAAEAALLGQLIRDPQVEHTWIVYRKDDRIVKIEPMSLNKKGVTQAGDFAHIKKMAAKEKADSILRIHNHPSGIAKWSQADKRAAMQWHRELGTLMAEDIIVDSGTYAYRTFENGEYTWHEDTVLDPDVVGWDTGMFAVMDDSGEQKPTDPLYQNPLIRGARQAATYMLGLKHNMDAAELIFVDTKTGKVSDTLTDTLLRTSQNDAEIVARLKALIAERPGQHVHIMMWGGVEAMTTAKVLMKNEIAGMDSVWVNNTRGQGIETINISETGDTATDTTTDTDTLADYQPTAETPNINRATRAMPTKDQLNLQGKKRTRKWLSPQSQLFEKLRLWTPKLRRETRVLMNAVRSGYGLLEELKSPWDADKPGPGDIIEDMLDQRMHLAQTWTGRTRSILTPVLKQLQQQVKRTDPKNSAALRAAVDHDIINFIEHNTPLRSEFRAFEGVATQLKESWRQVNQSYLEAMIGLIRDISHREDITKIGTRGREKWSPEPLGDLVWSWDIKDPDGAEGAFVHKDALKAIKAAVANPAQQQLDIPDSIKTYTIAEAFAETDVLWYPHQYDRSRLRDYNRKMENLVKALNQLAVAGDQADADALKAAGVEKVANGYLHRKLGIEFPDIDGVIAFYTDIRDRTATLLKMYRDGTIGMYPHLERVRETHDRLYRRDTNILMSTAALLWDRFAEIAMFGQIDDLGDLPPRLATILQTVELFNANDRERALMAVIDGLQATKASRIEASERGDDQGWGMHESIPAFAGGEAAALRIMQQWEDYFIDDDGNKVKTGKWKGIDINRLGLTDRDLGVLEQIGFIQPDGEGGWQVHGTTDAAQQKTIARFFVELMQTKAQRKEKIEGLVRALGHWQPEDPISEHGGELWKRMNTLISMGALGWKQALQNLTEIPAGAMLAGMKSTVGVIRNMQDPDFRAAAAELTQGLKQGIEFLADDNLQERYLDSKWSMFGYTERVSRLIGVGIGLTHAKNLSQEFLASQPGTKNRARLEREMRRLRMNPDAIGEMSPGELGAIFAEVIQRIKSQDISLAGVELASKTPPTHELTDRIGEEWVRSAMYVSDAVFKPYDARTLPDAFNSTDPRFRVFLKFKGWMLQQNRFMLDTYKRAGQEAIRHKNYRPLQNVLASTLLLTGSVGATQWVFSQLQGREDDDELLRAFLHTQTLGLTAVLWEMALRSEGSPWRLEKTLEGTLVGPVWGTFADVLSPTATGDLDRTLQEVFQRTPVARELLYLGGNQWWEDE